MRTRSNVSRPLQSMCVILHTQVIHLIDPVMYRITPPIIRFSCSSYAEFQVACKLLSKIIKRLILILFIQQNITRLSDVKTKSYIRFLPNEIIFAQLNAKSEIVGLQMSRKCNEQWQISHRLLLQFSFHYSSLEYRNSSEARLNHEMVNFVCVLN